MVWYGMVWYVVALCCVVLCCVVLCCAVLCCAVLCCVVLWCAFWLEYGMIPGSLKSNSHRTGEAYKFLPPSNPHFKFSTEKGDRA